MENSLYIIPISIIVTLFLLFIFASISSKKFSKRRRNDIYRQLKDIKSNIDLNISSANRDSIVRLDSLLSKVLQHFNSNKVSCGENLKLIRKKVKKQLYEDIWYYHKLRNRVVHENIDVTTSDAKEAYTTYYNLITELVK